MSISYSSGEARCPQRVDVTLATTQAPIVLVDSDASHVIVKKDAVAQTVVDVVLSGNTLIITTTEDLSGGTITVSLAAGALSDGGGLSGNMLDQSTTDGMESPLPALPPCTGPRSWELYSPAGRQRVPFELREEMIAQGCTEFTTAMASTDALYLEAGQIAYDNQYRKNIVAGSSAAWARTASILYYWSSTGEMLPA